MRRLSVVFTVTLAACGGSGGDTVDPAVPNGKSGAYTYTGTVPGTLIEAFCENGAYYSVTSTDNGTSKHPFELELPAGLGCSLVMTTNEDDPANAVVNPIGFLDANNQLSPVATGTSGAVINLGNIALYIDRDSASGFDADGDGVLDQPLELGKPEGLEVQEDSGPSTLDEDDDDVIDYYDDEDDDGVPNHRDSDYSRRSSDRDADGLDDDVDVNPDNDPDASNTYPEHMDHDGDGYLDEDSDHDGYYDDDHDRDGLHDDDEDGDGYHDDDEDRDGFSDSDGGSEAYSETKGAVASVTDNGFTLKVSSSEGADGIAAGSTITVDASNARFEGTSSSAITAGDRVEVKGSWDGEVFQAFKVEADD